MFNAGSTTFQAYSDAADFSSAAMHASESSPLQEPSVASGFLSEVVDAVGHMGGKAVVVSAHPPAGVDGDDLGAVAVGLEERVWAWILVP